MRATPVVAVGVACLVPQSASSWGTRVPLATGFKVRSALAKHRVRKRSNAIARWCVLGVYSEKYGFIPRTGNSSTRNKSIERFRATLFVRTYASVENEIIIDLGVSDGCGAALLECCHGILGTRLPCGKPQTAVNCSPYVYRSDRRCHSLKFFV